MKKFLLLVVVIALSITNLPAQTETGSQNKGMIIGISPFRLWNGVRVKVEKPLNPKFSVGGLVTGYYGNFPGVQLAPTGRFYFKSHAPEGFYGQAKAVVGLQGTKGVPGLGLNFGAGVAAGYQVLFGKDDKWSFDFNLGFKFVSLPNVHQDTGEGFDKKSVENAFSGVAWYLTGPGSFVDGLISIGYRF